MDPVESCRPGLSHMTCAECPMLGERGGHPLCLNWTQILQQNTDRKPIRCAECLLETRGDLTD